MIANPCVRCGWAGKFGDWDFVEMTSACSDGYACEHINGQRRCDSCTSDWFWVGNDSTWDIDGCEKQDCPSCVEANAAEAALPKCIQCSEPYETRIYEDASDLCDHCRCEWCGSADEATTKRHVLDRDVFVDRMICDGCHREYRQGLAAEGHGDYLRDLAKDERISR